MAAEGGDAVLGEALISRLGDAVDLNAATVVKLLVGRTSEQDYA